MNRPKTPRPRLPRRGLLQGLAAAAVPASASAAQAGWSNSVAKMLRETFLHHWADTKDYTMKVAEAMPAEAYASKPNPAQRGFGDQMVHIARANNAYFNAFGLGGPPEPPKTAGKDEVRAYLTASFDYVNGILGKLTEKDLMRTDIKFNPKLPPHSGTDVFLRAYMHTAHHRGQVITYLRVNNIVPPSWKFEPSGS